MHTGIGTEIPFLNGRYKALCAKQWVLIKALGVNGTRKVVDHLRELGCCVEWIRDRWQWNSGIQLDKALDYMKSRAYSFTTVAPDNVHLKAIETIESELKDQFGSLATEVNIPNEIYIAVILRSG